MVVVVIPVMAFPDVFGRLGLGLVLWFVFGMLSVLGLGLRLELALVVAVGEREGRGRRRHRPVRPGGPCGRVGNRGL